MIAVDLGNTRIKFGFFQNGSNKETVPKPDSVLAVDSLFAVESSGFEAVADWLDGLEEKPATWYIAPTSDFPWNELQTKLTGFRPHDRFEKISYKNIPISVDVEFPEKLGLDRLLSVYAASCWRTFNADAANLEKETRILVVDAGSAITVDLLAGEGYFAGGAILPGLNAMAESLTKISSQLPRITTADISFAVYPGKNTEEALASGIYWGAVGAIRQFHQLVQTTLCDAGLPNRVPIFLVGGDAEHIRIGLSLFMESENLFLFPDLVLRGIALTVQNQLVVSAYNNQ